MRVGRDGGDRVVRYRFPPPVLFMAPAVVGWAVNRMGPLEFLPRGVSLAAGIPLIAVAGVLVAAAAVLMRRAGTSPEPWRPTTALVTGGPFRFSRNPIYLAYTLGYVGFGCVVNSLWVLLLLPVALAAVHFGFIVREERYLARRFGDEYAAYAARVRRWL
ncbi:MAG: isoprenylcysteine carboxylmethyltransferase family protein [Dehalococcoidia bacterium]